MGTDLRRPLSRLTTYLLLAVVLGCGESPIRPDHDGLESGASVGSCLDLKLAEGGFTSGSPAKVSLFFTVDTCGGLPVSGLTSDKFEILEDGKVVSPYESQQAIQPRGQKFRIYSLVLIDLSGSLLRSGEFPKLRDASVALVQKLTGDGSGNQVAVYGFDGRANIFPVSNFTSDTQTLVNAIDSLSVEECRVAADCAAYSDRRSCAGWRCVDDSTNLNGAVVQGLERVDQALDSDPTISFRKGALVVFTDGTDQAGRVTVKDTRARVEASKHRVFSVGLGGEVDESVLKAYGKDGFQPASRPEELASAFDQVASRIASEANRFYFLEYCSPKRGGTHKLQVVATAEVQGKTLRGKLEQNFDAAGFSSGCEILQSQSNDTVER